MYNPQRLHSAHTEYTALYLSAQLILAKHGSQHRDVKQAWTQLDYGELQRNREQWTSEQHGVQLKHSNSNYNMGRWLWNATNIWEQTYTSNNLLHKARQRYVTGWGLVKQWFHNSIQHTFGVHICAILSSHRRPPHLVEAARVQQSKNYNTHKLYSNWRTHCILFKTYVQCIQYIQPVYCTAQYNKYNTRNLCSTIHTTHQYNIVVCNQIATL